MRNFAVPHNRAFEEGDGEQRDMASPRFWNYAFATEGFMKICLCVIVADIQNNVDPSTWIILNDGGTPGQWLYLIQMFCKKDWLLSKTVNWSSSLRFMQLN